MWRTCSALTRCSPSRETPKGLQIEWRLLSFQIESSGGEEGYFRLAHWYHRSGYDNFLSLVWERLKFAKHALRQKSLAVNSEFAIFYRHQ